MLSWTYNTLIAYLVLALAVSAVHASDEFQPTRRGHANLKRMIRKREPQREDPALVPVIGAGEDPAENPPVTSSSIAVSSTTSSSTTISSSSSSATTSSTSTGASDIPNLVNTLLSGLVSESTSASTSSSTLTSSSVSSAATTSSSSTPVNEAPTTPPPQAPVPTSTHSKSTSTVIKTQEQADAATSVPAPTGAAATKSKTLEIIIIVASSVGGIAILWTVFRKWKLGRSSKFDERLQPIDWQKPTGESNNNDDIPGIRRAPSNASSFHSASVHGHRGDAANLQPIPEHDFTAGAAPVGGYADLARGPSPPMGQVHSGAALGRGYEYDNAVPLHHQAGGAYGAYDYQGATRY